MSAGTLPYESIIPAEMNFPSSPAAADGAAQVTFVCDQSNSRLNFLYYRNPLKILFPQVPKGEPPMAVLVTIGGGYLAGDRYAIDVTVENRAKALITSQAAEKVYKSNGPESHVNIDLHVAANGELEWLPQETIVFDRSRFRRTLRIDVAESGKALVGDLIVLGRLASGERFTEGLLRDAWEVRRGNRLVWVDALHLEQETLAALNHPTGLDGIRAFATAVFIGDEAAVLLNDARCDQETSEDVLATAGLVNGLLVFRWLSPTPLALRKAIGSFWSRFRDRSLGRSTTLPAIWNC